MLMRSPGAPWSGCRGFQPVNVASGVLSSTGRTPGTSLPSSSTAGTNVTNGAPILGGSSPTTPRSKPPPEVEPAGALDAVREPDAGQWGEARPHRAGGDRRAVGDPGDRARRRLDALADPAVKVHER